MKSMVCISALAVSLSLSSAGSALADKLASWSENPNRAATSEFIDVVTDKGSKDYVVPESQAIVFDKVGTHWIENPHLSRLTRSKSKSQQWRLETRSGNFLMVSVKSDFTDVLKS